MDVRVDRAGGEYQLLASDRLSSRADDHILTHAVHHVGITRLADADDRVATYADVRLHHAEHGVDDQRVGDHDVERRRRRRAGRLAHPLAQHLK